MPVYRCRIVSNYGTFTVTRTIDLLAPSVDLAHDQAFTATGLIADLQAAGWVCLSGPDGESHDIEITEVDEVAYRVPDRNRVYGD